MRNGFSLVELLVVIIIVGILASVSVPIYEGFTSKAKLTEMYDTVAIIETAVKMHSLRGEGVANDLPWTTSDAARLVYKDTLGVDIPASDKFEYVLSGSVTYDGNGIWTKGPAITTRVKGIAGNLCEKWIKDGWVKLDHPWAKYLNE